MEASIFLVLLCLRFLGLLSLLRELETLSPEPQPSDLHELPPVYGIW